MNDDDLKGLVNDVEARSYEYDFQIADEFKKIANENEVSKSQTRLLESEFIAFRFMSRNDGKRFRPMMEYTNGAVFPDDAKEITKERLKYWLERAHETSNPVMRARYFDLNYEYNKSADKLELAKEAIVSYIDAAKVAVEGNEIDRIDSITRAVKIAIENEDKLPELFENAKNALVDLALKFADDNLRWSLDLIELAVVLSDHFSTDDFQQFKKLADDGVAHFRKEDGSFLILESYLKAQQDVNKIVNPDKFDADAATRENAQIYIDAAEADTSPFLQQIQLMQAQKILRDGGLSQDANKIHARIEAIARDPAFTDNFKEFSAEFEIPHAETEKLKSDFVKSTEKASVLALSPVLMPSWKEAKKQAASETGAMVQDMFTSITYNEDNMPIAKAPGDDKLRKIMRHYDSAVMVSDTMTEIATLEALKGGHFTIDDIMPQLEKIKDLNPDTYESVVKGFKHLFAEDYYEALSILLPQLEDLLADIMVGLGFTRYRQAEVDTVDFKMLGSILTALKKQYGDDAYHYLHYKLIDPEKANLRNMNGHGELKVNDKNLYKKALNTMQAYMVVLVPLTKK